MTPDWFGVAGFGLALALGGLKFWETFFRKSKFELYCEWSHLEDGVYEIEMTVANVGWRKDSLVFFHFRTPAREGDPPEREWVEWEMQGSDWPSLPAVVLDVDAVAGRFSLPMAALEEMQMARLAREMVDGQAEAVLVNARMERTCAAIPGFPHEGPRPPTPGELR